MIHGLQPGPLMISQRPEVFWGFVASMYIGNFLLLILNLPLVGVFVSVLRLPQHVLATLVLLLCLVGAFSLNNSFLDLWILVVFGVFGYALRKLEVDASPLVVALVLGPMMEKTLRQSLFLTRGSLVELVSRPLTAVILLVALRRPRGSTARPAGAARPDGGRGSGIACLTATRRAARGAARRSPGRAGRAGPGTARGPARGRGPAAGAHGGHEVSRMSVRRPRSASRVSAPGGSTFSTRAGRPERITTRCERWSTSSRLRVTSTMLHRASSWRSWRPHSFADVPTSSPVLPVPVASRLP